MVAAKSVMYNGVKYVLASNTMARQKELQKIAKSFGCFKSGIVGDGFYFKFHDQKKAQLFTDRVKTLELPAHEVARVLDGWQAYVAF